jgi:hypothetical protein
MAWADGQFIYLAFDENNVVRFAAFCKFNLCASFPSLRAALLMLLIFFIA